MNGETYSVESASPEDAAGIAHVYVEAWRSAYAGILPDPVLVGMSPLRQARQWHHRIRQSGRPGRSPEAVFVAKLENGDIIGFGNSGYSRDQDLSYAAEVYTLYVDPDYLDHGVGRALLTTLFSNLVLSGHKSALIWALADNPYRHFYSAMGGQIVAERQSYYWSKSLREIGYGWSDLIVWNEQQSAQRSALH